MPGLTVAPVSAVTSAVLVIGEANRRFYDHYGVARSQQFFTPYSVDNDFFLTQRSIVEKSRQDLRRLHDWPEDVFVIGFSG